MQMNRGIRKKEENSIPFGIDFVFAAVFLALVFAVANDKQFATDGAFYFIRILQEKDFTYTDWHRQFSNYLSQWPLVLSLQLGISNPGFLKTIFGAGLLLPYFVAYLIARWQTSRGVPPFFLYSYIFALVAITLSSDFVLYGEHQLVLPLAWPILGYLLYPRNFPVSSLWIPVVFSFFMVLTYQPVIVIFTLFFMVLFFFWKKEFVFRGKAMDEYKTVGLLLCIFWAIGIAVALHGILFPRSLENRSSFIAGIYYTALNPVLQTALASLTGFLIYLRFPRTRPLLLGIGIIAGIYIWHYRFSLFSAYISFSSRALVLLLLPLLVLITAWAVKNFSMSRVSSSGFAAFMMLPVLANIASTNVWHDFSEKVREVAVCGRTELVPASEHRLNSHPASWSWTFPSLSIALGGPNVRSLLENANGTWQPFDPRSTRPIPEFAGYAQNSSGGKERLPSQASDKLPAMCGKNGSLWLQYASPRS